MKQVISASRRTDIPAWYGGWFRQRLETGRAAYRNPFSGKIHTVSLDPGDVAAFVFWTRDASPFLAVLDLVDDRCIPYYFQYTLTGYPPSIEKHVSYEKSLRGLLALAGRIGPDRVVWRYDPILFTGELTIDRHRENFDRIARTLAGSVRTVTVSFLDRYRKIERRMAGSGLAIVDPRPDEAAEMLLQLEEIAGEYGISLNTCCEEDVRPDSVARGACVDGERLRSIIPDDRWRPRPGATREGCACAASRDIGAYDTCLFGCVYCYAVGSHERALRNAAAHRPENDLLIE